MKLGEFVEDYNMLSEGLGDFAVAAMRVEDCPELVTAAKAFAVAHDAFYEALETVGVEVG